ncbi:MAG: hypothetical protein ACJARI_003764 [Bacteroidia bacterium]|jgi:hypothetical protein
MGVALRVVTQFQGVCRNLNGMSMGLAVFGIWTIFGAKLKKLAIFS